MLQYYHHEIGDEGWKFKPLGCKTCRTPNWIQSVDKVKLGIALVLSVACRSKSDGIFRWVEYMNLKNCLNEVIYYIRWLGHMARSLYWSSLKPRIYFDF